MEPRFVRILRPKQRPDIPQCGRCGRPLNRLRKRWCSDRCREYAGRWARELAAYGGVAMTGATMRGMD